MSVVSFTDYRPAPRYDGEAWVEARIEGSDLEAGPWAEIETIALDPVDTDPADPLSRSFTTELATDEVWFRVVFVDEDGDEQATDPITMGSWRPTIGEVAAILRARTKPRHGQDPTGTFNANTRPTGDEVDALITQACAQIAASFLGDVPESSEDDARQAAALRTAVLIEVTYPEQTEDGGLNPALSQQADDAMTTLINTANVRSLFAETAPE